MDTPHSDLEAIRQILADLTTRIYRIERRLQMDAAAADTRPATATKPVLPTPSAETSSLSMQAETQVPRVARDDNPATPRMSYMVRAHSEPDLEARIGSHWLNRIGIAALLIGISYFLKFAFDSNWIGPAGRVTIGLLAGIAMVAWSERFRTRGYMAFSYSLKAVGVRAIFLSVWAGFQVYALIPNSVAFVIMLAVAAATAAMAWAQDAQILAAFALTGGFSTPILLSTGQNRELPL